MDRLKDKVAFITGAGRGIGRGIAERFAQEGAKVCLTDVNEETVSATAKDLQGQGFDVISAVVNVSEPEQVNAAIAKTAEQFGRLDILVNNAGVLRDNLIFKMSDDDWDTVMAVHLRGAFLCSRAAQKVMVSQKYGRIISLSSTSALGNRGQVNYATAKAGLQGLTRTLAIELGRYGITANAIAPGFIETDMTRITAERMGVSFDQFVQGASAVIPAGRIGQPADIAAAATFFASEEAGFVNGQVLYVAGGPDHF